MTQRPDPVPLDPRARELLGATTILPVVLAGRSGQPAPLVYGGYGLAVAVHAVDALTVREELLHRRALDAKSLRHAEVLVEDHDDDGVVIRVADWTEIAPPARSRLAQGLDLQPLAGGQPDVPAGLDEAPAFAAVVRGDYRLGEVSHRVVVRADDLAGAKVAHDRRPIRKELSR